MQITPLASIAPGTPTTPAQPANSDRPKLIQAVQALNRAESFGPQNELTFSLDRRTRQPVLRIVDKKSGEVLQQLPTEEVLRRAAEEKG